MINQYFNVITVKNPLFEPLLTYVKYLYLITFVFTFFGGVNLGQTPPQTQKGIANVTHFKRIMFTTTLFLLIRSTHSPMTGDH